LDEGGIDGGSKTRAVEGFKDTAGKIFAPVYRVPAE